MKKETSRIQYLLKKYLNDNCTRAEYEELIKLSQEPENEKYIMENNRITWRDTDQVKHRVPETGRQVHTTWPIVLKIAASLLILVMVGFALNQWLNHSEPIVYTTGNGEVKEIVLPDSTRVTLNANSNLVWYPTRFQKEDRLVHLTGEAYFKVTKKARTEGKASEFRGFQVKTSRMTIHVTGTEFNVMARQKNTEVFLQEGSVEYELVDNQSLLEPMSPGEKITIDNQTGNLTKTQSENLSTSASWITGILNYNNKSLGEVLRNLSELFGVEITCEDQDLNSKKINLGVPYKDWENTKRALEMAINVQFKKENDQYSVVQK